VTKTKRVLGKSVQEPPRDLSRSAAAWWVDVLRVFELRDDELAVLVLACRALDRVAEAREAVTRDGAYVAGRFGMKAHPALTQERNAALLFSRLLRQLGLPPEAAPTEVPRPTVLGRRGTFSA
jgi:phage terminase small subunit